MQKKAVTSLFCFCAGIIGVAYSFILGNILTMMISSVIIVSVSLVFAVMVVNKFYSIAREVSAIKSDGHELKRPGFLHVHEVQNDLKSIRNRFDVSVKMIEKIGTQQFKNLSDQNDSKDKLTSSIKDIHIRLEQLKEAESKHSWITHEVAAFSEVLRNKCELKEYSHQIIRQLVKSLSANQAGLFIEHQEADGTRYLDLAACYAYGKRKVTESKIFEGQGLLGQCMLEMDYVFLTDVPKDYVRITSGLGEATPRNIVVAPLVFNNQFYGAIELAFFEVLRPHEMEFLKIIAVNIAAEIASLTGMKHTQELLDQSEILARELKDREEALKQNVEELAATQEEMVLKQAELSGIVKAIDATVATAEFDLAGNLKNANDIFLQVMGYKLAEVIGKKKSFFMGEEASAVMLWENLKLGKFFSGEFKMRDKAGKTVWLSGTFNPIFLNGNIPQKILMFAQFTTQEKEKLQDLQGTVSAFKSTLPVLELSGDLKCKSANEKFLHMFEVSRMELKSKTVLDFIDPYYHGLWKAKVEEVLTRDFVTTSLPLVFKKGTINYEVTISVVKDLEAKTSRVILALVKEVEQAVPLLAVV